MNQNHVFHNQLGRRCIEEATMPMIRWTAILLNVVVLLAALLMFFADARGFGSREIAHYIGIGLFVVTSATSVTSLWLPNGKSSSSGTARGPATSDVTF
jgi:quinol-cytochrome oxidoreductase complex cytochrome b subunit